MDHTTLSELSAPSRRLAAACILSAYRDVWKPTVGGSDKLPEQKREIQREAREWFCSNDYDFYSFRYLCDVLSMEPTVIRQQVLTEWRQFKLTSHQTQEKEDCYEY